jgi:hypothetical protein
VSAELMAQRPGMPRPMGPVGNPRSGGGGMGPGGMPGQQPFGNENDNENEEKNKNQAQGDPRKILDDSTKNIYGPNTTKFVLEKDIRFNRENYRELDTLINNFHNYNPVDRSGRLYQDLGTVGTAIRPYFYTIPQSIGITSGFHSYDPYFNSPDRIRYFDTKSPFTDLTFVLGGGERSFTDITFSRNINPLWNIGGDFKRITADRQVGPNIRRGDRQTESTAYDLYTRFRSKNEKYQLLANFSRLNQKINEIGGVNTENGLLDPFSQEADVLLGSTRSNDYRYNIHLYQQYRFNIGLDAYHVVDYSKQRNSFIAGLGNKEVEFFEPAVLANDSTRDEANFRVITNELGFKGKQGVFYYNLFLKRRDLGYTYKIREGITPQRQPVFSETGGGENENFAGFNIRFDITRNKYLEFFGEYLIAASYLESKDDNLGRLGANLNAGLLNVSFSRQKYAPSLITQRFVSNHKSWNNKFNSINSDVLNANVPINLGFFSFRPQVTASRITNFVYFNEDKVPTQIEGANNSVFLLSPGADVNFSLFKRKINWENSVFYTVKSGKEADVFRIPEIFGVSRLYYANHLFNSNLQIAAGVEAFYRSDFMAMGFDPVTQQFHIQNDIMVNAYPAVDLFVNMRIKRVRVTAKMVHLNQGFPSTGYYATPLYPGQKRIFDFGVSWLFFD